MLRCLILPDLELGQHVSVPPASGDAASSPEAI